MDVSENVSHSCRLETAVAANICERRVSSDSREIASEGRNPRQVTDLPHTADRTRRRDFPRRRAVRRRSGFRPAPANLTKSNWAAESPETSLTDQSKDMIDT